MAASISDTSWLQNSTLFIHMLKNWTGFEDLGEYASSINPFWILLLPMLLYHAYCFIFLLNCFTSFVLYIYKKKHNISGSIYDPLWEKPRQWIGHFVETFGKIWHGYEVIGMENLPKGPGIIVFYHGAFVLDYILLVARLYAQKGRSLYSVAHRDMFLPGVKLVLDVVGCIVGTKVNCVEILKKGHLLGIAPGGLREGNFSDEYYNLVWGSGTGFAQVALDAKVPIIPMFTQNLREAYRTVGKTRLLKWLYERTKLLVLPLYGGFPVKLRTYIGEPIPYDPNLTAKELAEKAKIAIEDLRNKYQKRPGNILRALSERFDKHHKNN
nr:monoacylglycerol/Diacylglycerol O-acyltransferase-like [Anolis sagrei ordinatus]